MTLSDIELKFTYHPPHGDQAHRYAEIRAQARALATAIWRDSPKDKNKEVPRETEIAIEKLREAVMWANAGIAVNESLLNEK